MWIEQSEIEKFFPALNLRVCHSQELFCPFPALLLVSPYKGVEVSSSCHGASHLYSGLCRLLFLPLQEFRGPSPFQICGQETRSKLMEKFSAAGFPGSGGMEREQEHARGRDAGMESSRSTHSLAV